MAKVYTKTGDKGQTSLVGGTRVSKADSRLSAYGEIDELNSTIGLFVAQSKDALLSDDMKILNLVQNNLFVIGSHLACEADKVKTFKLPNLNETIITDLEKRMDILQAELPELKNFILPSGTIASTYSHVCRTVCRRAERSMVMACESEEVDKDFIMLVNRLSDYFFVLARSLNFKHGVNEELWNPN